MYEHEFSAHEWNVACTLELKDDGRFEYGEYRTCYMAAASGDVRGSWSRAGDTIVLRADECDGFTFLRLPIGEEIRAVVRGDGLGLGDGTAFRLREEAPASLPPPPPPSRDPLPPASAAPAVAAPMVPAGAPAPPSPPEPMESGETRRRAGLRTPPPDLAARIRELITRLPGGAAGEGIIRLCQLDEMLPLAANSVYLWGLRPDGVLLCVDHESFARREEAETDPVTAYGAMMQGARRYPELQPLVPERPPGVVRCGACDGRGSVPAPGERIADGCPRCMGLGWHRG